MPAAPPRSTDSLPASSLMSATTTRAPPVASRAATARPIPEPAPVTNAILPSAPTLLSSLPPLCPSVRAMDTSQSFPTWEGRAGPGRRRSALPGAAARRLDPDAHRHEQDDALDQVGDPRVLRVPQLQALDADGEQVHGDDGAEHVEPAGLDLSRAEE